MKELNQEIFRWAYAGVVFAAQRCLEHANAARLTVHEWPAGQTWNEINGSSRSIFLYQARVLLGIPHDVFLEIVRTADVDIDDLFDKIFKVGKQ